MSFCDNLSIFFGKLIFFILKIFIKLLEFIFSHFEDIINLIIYGIFISLISDSLNKGIEYSLTLISITFIILTCIVVFWFVLWHLILKHLDFVQELLGNKQITNRPKKFRYVFKKRINNEINNF